MQLSASGCGLVVAVAQAALCAHQEGGGGGGGGGGKRGKGRKALADRRRGDGGAVDHDVHGTQLVKHVAEPFAGLQVNLGGMQVRMPLPD